MAGGGMAKVKADINGVGSRGAGIIGSGNRGAAYKFVSCKSDGKCV